MELPSYFKEFLSAIEPSESYRKGAIDGHQTLRERLEKDSDFAKYHVETFLQGSYARKTAVQPIKDVDVCVIMNVDADKTKPADAFSILRKALEEYYKGKLTTQNRSIRVDLSAVTLDVVPTAAPSGPDNELRIPDRSLKEWQWTHPKKQQTYTEDLNRASGGLFVPLVKMFKWWRGEAAGKGKHEPPKGYVLEVLTGMCFDSTVRDHATGFVRLLRTIESCFAGMAAGREPRGWEWKLPDPGTGQNAAKRISFEEFKAFIEKVVQSRDIAEKALQENDKARSTKLWRDVFGDRFPEWTDDGPGRGTEGKGPFVAPSIKSQTGDLTPRRYG